MKFVQDFAYKNYIVVVMILSDLLFLIWTVLRDSVSNMAIVVTAASLYSRCDGVHTSCRPISTSQQHHVYQLPWPHAPAVKLYQLQETEYSKVTSSARCNCAIAGADVHQCTHWSLHVCTRRARSVL